MIMVHYTMVCYPLLINSILGIPSYLKHGYIPSHDESESVSKTLEYAYDDWCIAQLAKEMNDSLSFQLIHIKGTII